MRFLISTSKGNQPPFVHTDDSYLSKDEAITGGFKSFVIFSSEIRVLSLMIEELLQRKFQHFQYAGNVENDNIVGSRMWKCPAKNDGMKHHDLDSRHDVFLTYIKKSDLLDLIKEKELNCKKCTFKYDLPFDLIDYSNLQKIKKDSNTMYYNDENKKLVDQLSKLENELKNRVAKNTLTNSNPN